ncbi:glycosyltransferase family protein [Gemmobacter denitrificans]|uniref:Glycosyltransferase family protein n=1 Tax=Gemmobacter denitrificans TaxID=3123040 RepID=A0ABU8BTR5_9RHOB
MKERQRNPRVLMYSHDTFGLGHLRRCRAIAHALVQDHRGMMVLIISGSQIAGAFDYRSRVDFVKIPSVIKLRNGEYTSLSEHIDLRDTIEMRRSIIRHTAESFRPDIFIVDKEPMGLRGEIEDTLAYLKTQGTTLVLGLRDVMDAPHLLQAEWARNDVMTKIDRLFDHVWVYGPPDFYDPLTGLDVPPGLRARMDFTGFLQRSANADLGSENRPDGDYILVTTGGGGDGADLVNCVISAYEQDAGLTDRALIVLGPYMSSEMRAEFRQRGARQPLLEVIDFDMRMEELIEGARAVVGMGGYNTYCEILSFDKPALIVPRTEPREEQLLRATRAAELGMIRMLLPEEATNPVTMAAALKALPRMARPSEGWADLRMEGLQTISSLVGEYLHGKSESESVALKQAAT